MKDITYDFPKLYMEVDGKYEKVGRINDTNIIKHLDDSTEISMNGKIDRMPKNLLSIIDSGFYIGKQPTKMPKRYIINENATILFWENGEKTIVKKCKDDEFNPRLAFLTAFFQHYCGMSKNKANKYLASLKLEEDEITKEKNIIVTVERTGLTYSTYKDFIKQNFPTYEKNFVFGEIPKANKKYQLIGKAKHENADIMLALIQDRDTKQVFIIGEEGIKEEN